jgi:hypothetical protein
MKQSSLLSLFLILVFVLGGCEPVSSTMQPTQGPSAISPATTMPVPTPTLTPTITETASPTPTATARLPTATHPLPTKTPVNTLAPMEIQATIQPFLSDPMNCAVPCFWGIIPGKTHFDEAKAFFNRLQLSPFVGNVEGRDFYTIEYLPGTDYDFSVTLFPKNNLVESIVVTPRIAKQEAGSPRKWIAYSPETLIRRFGKPVRVEFGLDWGPNFVIVMIMYFDPSDLIVYYSGYYMIPSRPHLIICGFGWAIMRQTSHLRTFHWKKPLH